MTRLALICVTLLSVGMLVGGEGSRKPSRCHLIAGIARICNAAAATSKPDVIAGRKFAARYKARFDLVMRRHGWQVTWIACLPTVPGGEAVYACSVRMHYTVAPIRDLCRKVVVGTDWRTFGVQAVVCPVKAAAA